MSHIFMTHFHGDILPPEPMLKERWKDLYKERGEGHGEMGYNICRRLPGGSKKPRGSCTGYSS